MKNLRVALAMSLVATLFGVPRVTRAQEAASAGGRCLRGAR